MSFSPKENGKRLVKNPYVLIQTGNMLLVYQSAKEVDNRHAIINNVENIIIPRRIKTELDNLFLPTNINLQNEINTYQL